MIVGAGAVGQVLGKHLVGAGVEVAFQVRDRARIELPFRLWRLGVGRRPVEERFTARVCDRVEDVAAFDPDLVWLTVPSNLLAGEWLPALLAAVPRAAVVAMEPGAEDEAVIAAAAPGRAVTRGIVAFIAYQAPLVGEDLPARGIAYWCPGPLACPFAGPDAARVVAALREGGLRAVEQREVAAGAAHGAAVMALYVASLRRSGWKLATWGRSPEIATAGAAVREAAAAIGRPPLWVRALTPAVVSAGVRLAARVFPLPLETYLEWHFTKIAGQTRENVAALVELAERTTGRAGALRDVAGWTAVDAGAADRRAG